MSESPYFAYADQLRKHSPVIAYACDRLGTELLMESLKHNKNKFE